MRDIINGLGLDQYVLEQTYFSAVLKVEGIVYKLDMNSPIVTLLQIIGHVTCLNRDDITISSDEVIDITGSYNSNTKQLTINKEV